MHVLIIPSELYCPPALPLYGIFQKHQAELLAANGIQTGVVSFGYMPWGYGLSGFPYPEFESTNGVNVCRRFVRPVIPARFAYPAFRQQLVVQSVELVKTYIERFGKPDIVHAHNAFCAGLVASRIRRRYGIPFVLTEHSSVFQEGLLSTRDLRRVREIFESASLLSAVGSTVAGRMMALAPPCHSSSVVLGNVLDPWIEQRARATPLSESVSKCTEFNLLSIGSLVAVKNHDLLLRAFTRAFKGDSTARLRIGGSGRLNQVLQRHARELEVSGQVEFLGRLTREEVVQEILRSHTMVLSSVAETFGVVLIEAMAFGKPVVSTRCGGPEEIVNEQNGILVDNDHESLADGLLRMREACFDARSVRKFCFDAYGSAAFWSRLKAIYETVLGRPIT